MSQFILPGPVLEIALTANVNDLDIAGATVVDITPDADWSITGIDGDVHGNGVIESRMVLLRNRSASFTISLPGLDAGSLAVNQFGWSGTHDIPPRGAALITRTADDDLWLGQGRETTSTIPFDDSLKLIKGSSTPSKGVRFEVDTNVPADTTVAIAIPSSNGTLATLERVETFTNKSLAGAKVITDGAFTGFYDTNGNELLQMSGVASAVNHPLLTSAVTGSGPILGPGTGGDTNPDMNVRGRGTGVVNVGIAGAERAFAGKATSNPGTTSEGADHYRTDLEEPFFYDASRSKWLGYAILNEHFGRAGTGLSGDLRGYAGATLSTTHGYYTPYACTIVGMSWAASAYSTATLIVRAGASTIITKASLSANSADMALNVDLAAGDLLNMNISAGTMDQPVVTIYMRRKAA